MEIILKILILFCRVSVKGVPINFSNEGKEEFTSEDLAARLKEMSDEEAAILMKNLLKDFEAEGSLVKLIAALNAGDPKKFIQDATNLADFKVAKLGGLKKMEKVLKDFDK